MTVPTLQEEGIASGLMPGIYAIKMGKDTIVASLITLKRVYGEAQFDILDATHAPVH